MSKLSAVASDFAGQIAIAVWLGKMTDDAAREALQSYAMAYRLAKRKPWVGMSDALLTEYRRRREGQEICS